MTNYSIKFMSFKEILIPDIYYALDIVLNYKNFPHE